MRGNTLRGSYKVDDFVRKQIGLNRAECNPRYRVDLVECLKQSKKTFFGAAAKIANIDPVSIISLIPCPGNGFCLLDNAWQLKGYGFCHVPKVWYGGVQK